MISYGRQSINKRDIESVIKVLKSDFLTQGPNVEKFEKELTEFTSSKYAVAVNSGTSALHIACLAIGLQKNDYLWTSAVSFVSSANCGLFCGAKIELIDIEKSSANIDLDLLEQKLIEAKKNKKLPKVIIPVHMSGQSVNMIRLKKLSIKYKFKIIEDASHALGSTYKNKPVGCGKYSDICVFSFHPVKSITTGEGGAALTNQKEIFKKLRSFRTHGIISNIELSKNGRKVLPWYYEQVDLGYNYRMSDISAALGISQLKRVDEFIKKRKLIAEKYFIALNGLPLKMTSLKQISSSSNHLYVIRIDKTMTKKNNLDLYNFFLKHQIKLNLHYIPIYRHPYYKQMKFKMKNFPNSERYYSEALSLPIYYSLSIKEQDKIISIIKNFF